VKYYGDGDSKSYKYVVDSDPYNGKKIKKLKIVWVTIRRDLEQLSGRLLLRIGWEREADWCDNK
jgi:hypothetical protein